MNDSDLDVLLAAPLPERDVGAFSVALMERIAREEARPARLAAWAMAALLTVVVAAALVLLGLAAGNSPFGGPLLLPGVMVALMLMLSFAVMRSVRE